mmetsp:Transcript_7295/g.13455  ORF Transcript_7295/g.13455 Transcript_7295/m.13455 type:complete len:120 (+) Transcript_7295:2162-2521(+)
MLSSRLLLDVSACAVGGVENECGCIVGEIAAAFDDGSFEARVEAAGITVTSLDSGIFGTASGIGFTCSKDSLCFRGDIVLPRKEPIFEDLSLGKSSGVITAAFLQQSEYLVLDLLEEIN